jgi:XTP/dITP diphosphohydrolase
MKLLFASSNQHKIDEIKQLLPATIELISLKDIDFVDEIPETADTIEGNAILKAQFLTQQLSIPCFADDTGLIVPSLNGEPGVFSARYAGPERDAEANMNLLLENLNHSNDRSAYFQTVIALVLDGKTHVFEGKVDGNILPSKKGAHGFGYDPIFEPENTGKSFAEMSATEKNNRSHRGRALAKMIDFLDHY